MRPPDCDLTLVTDPRFSGGTAQAFRSDLLALRAAGLRVGLVFFRAGAFFQPDDAENPALLDLLDLDGIVTAPARSAAVFLHNPQIFGPRQLARAATPLHLPRCDRLFMVAHHPPILGNGALCYDPVSTDRAVTARAGGAGTLEWLPISGLVREQLRSFQPLLTIAAEDWPNSFDTAAWTPRRAKLQGAQVTIGRHGRPHPDKWPDSAAQIAASLPSGPACKVRVLGADRAFFEARGVATQDWDLLPFGAAPPEAFLDGLDLFSYFHATHWREAFGRVVAEAMMMELRCILSPELRPTFGPNALYCQPTEVAALIAHIRTDLGAHRNAAIAAGAWCRESFDARQASARFARVMGRNARRLEPGPRALSPPVALRKWIGFHRRERAGGMT